MQFTLDLRPELIDRLEDAAIDRDVSLDALVEEYLERVLAESLRQSVRSPAMVQGLSDVLGYINQKDNLVNVQEISNGLSLSIKRVRELCHILIVAGKIKWSGKTNPGRKQGTIYYYPLGFSRPDEGLRNKGAIWQHIYNNPGCELCLISRITGVSIEDVGSIVRGLIADGKVRSQEKPLKAGACLTILFCC